MQNSKAFKILAFVALFLLIIFSWVLWKDARDKKLRETQQNSGLENPFGATDLENDLESQGQNQTPGGTTGQTTPTPNTVIPDGVAIIEDSPLLRQISDKPVAGMTFVTEERIIPEEESATPAEGLVEVYDFSGYRTIRFGDKADEIVAIKTVLNRQTPSPALVVNTDYDTDMKNAVVDFQNKNSLPGDGVIGSNTYKKLNAFQGITTFTSAPKPANIEQVLMARFVDAASGTISDRALRKNEEKKSVTTTSIPRVVEAMFDATGANVIMRYLKADVIETYLARLTFPKIDPNLPQAEKDKIPKIADISGEFLAEDVHTITVSKDKKNFFYLNPVSGGVAGLTYNFATKQKKQIFDSPLTEWIADWGSDTKISLTTKASGQAPGYAYAVDVKTSAMTRIVGNETGLTTNMSPDGKKFLYATYSAAGLKNFIFDTTSGVSTPVSPTTLPEKCVWTKDSKDIYCLAPTRALTGTLPDDWYKGKVSSEDALWITDMVNYNGNIVYDFKQKSGQSLDGVSPMLNAADDYLLFKNKKDGTLWGFDLSK